MDNNIETIVLGSGDCYCKEFNGTIPTNEEIEVDENLLGRIQGGTTLSYKPTFYTAKDDSGIAQKTIPTEEEVTFKTGVITFNGNTLKKLCSTARITDTSATRTIKIGGLKNDDKKKYLIHFVHEDAEDGDIRVTIVGKNESGFSLAFAKNKETVIDAEFKAAPSDDEGTLIIYEETIVSSDTESTTSDETTTDEDAA